MESDGSKVGRVECTDWDGDSADGRKSVVAISTQWRHLCTRDPRRVCSHYVGVCVADAIFQVRSRVPVALHQTSQMRGHIRRALAR